MPTPQTPLMMVDSIFDTIVQYPTAVLSATSEAVGHEAFRVASARRERQWWSPTAAAAGHYLQSYLGTVLTSAPDFWFLDRGHNLWGKTIEVRSSTTGTLPFGTTVISRVIPALDANGNFVVGGDPSTGVCVTEEGACYTLFPAGTARAYWQWYIVDNLLPVVPGVLLGKRSQLFAYSSIYDDDEAMRKVRTEESDAGYLATGRVYSYRTAQLDFTLIGDTDYDAQVRGLVQLLFHRDQPVVLCLNWGTYPARAWMFKYDGTRIAFPKDKVYRSGRFTLREVGALVK